MDLLTVKLFVIAGLLFLTFAAACLPLLIFLLPFTSNKNEYIRSSESSSRLSRLTKRIFPCLMRSEKRDKKLSTSSEFSEETDDNKKSNEQQGHGRKTRLFLDVMNCFSGGVFLGTSFLALMPEVREIFDEVGMTWPKFYPSVGNLTEVSDEENLMPVTEFLVTCGLFFILCLEQVVHSITDKKKHVNESNVEHKNATEEQNENEISNGTVGKANIMVSSDISSTAVIESEVVFGDDLVIDVGERQGEELQLAEKSQTKGKHHKEHHNDSIVRSLILVTTLSVHSLLEGLAIGLQKNASSALSIFIAVLFHKSLMAFSMGNNLLQSGQSTKRIITSACILALTSPIGIAVGAIMKESRDGTEIINGVLQGLATGTFLFITFFEVLSKEFSNHCNRVYKTLAFILGYCCILVVMFTQHGA